MNIQEEIYNKIQEMEIDFPLNITRSKYTYRDNNIQKVTNDYTPISENEIVFWYNKVNGQNFINF